MSLLNRYDVKIVNTIGINCNESRRQEVISRLRTYEPLVIDYLNQEGSPVFIVSTLDHEVIGSLPEELTSEICQMYPDRFLYARVNEIIAEGDGFNQDCYIHIDVMSKDEMPPDWEIYQELYDSACNDTDSPVNPVKRHLSLFMVISGCVLIAAGLLYLFFYSHKTVPVLVLSIFSPVIGLYLIIFGRKLTA